jgi:hypothetical protein
MHAALAALSRTPRPHDIPSVVTRLRTIEEALPARHGVACFTRLYRWTTENVGNAVTAGTFEAPDAMVILDVGFASLYFDAVDAWARGEPPPGAWAPLLERADHPGISPLRFALAGMHAHINRDLAVAVARASRRAPVERSPRFRDYQRINEVLDATSDAVRGALLPPVLSELDARLGECDDALILATIRVARRAAWEAAQLLWPLRRTPVAWAGAVDALDATVGAGARLLLLEPDADPAP